MTGIACVAVLVLTALGLGAWGPQVAYRTRRDVAVIDVHVTAGDRAVESLAPSDFEVRDNGVVQQILDFTQEAAPLDVRVIVDVSGSMTERDRVVVQRALAQVGETLRPVDRIGVWTFASHVSERVPLQHPPVAIALPQGDARVGDGRGRCHVARARHAARAGAPPVRAPHDGWRGYLVVLRCPHSARRLPSTRMVPLRSFWWRTARRVLSEGWRSPSPVLPVGRPSV